MEITQIYAELNTIIKGMTGTDDTPDVVDTTGLVSFGNDVLNAKNGVANFGKALGDRIARIITEVQRYIRRDRNLYSEPIDYGSALKIIHFKDTTNVANTMWGNTPNTNPFALGTQLDFTQSIFSRMGVWSYNNLIIQRDQFKKAFINAEELGAFLDSQFTVVYNEFELDIEACENIAVGTGMADCFSNKIDKPKRATNLLSDYNTKFTKTLTVDTCLSDKEFLRYASMVITKDLKSMRAKTEIFNNLEGVSMKCENPVIEVLSDFATNSQFYLESDAFHNELVQLPTYKEIEYWIGLGADASFSQKSEVSIKNDELTADISGVLAFIRDERAIRTTFNEVYSDSIYNPADRTTHYYFNAERGFMIDTAYPMSLYYIAEEQEEQEDS